MQINWQITRHVGFETGDGLTEDKLGSLVSLAVASALKVSLDEAFVQESLCHRF